MKANDGDFFTLEKKKGKKDCHILHLLSCVQDFGCSTYLYIFTFHAVQKVSVVHFHHLCSHHIPFPFQVFHLE